MPDIDLLPIDEQAAFGPAFEMAVDEDPQSEEAAAEQAARQQAQADLDPKAMDDFLGLTYLGRLEEECTVAGHRFLLCTPSQDDRLEMGLIHKPYLNTMSATNAWVMITVAAFVRRIDSVDEPVPLTVQPTSVRSRFDWIRNSITATVVIEKLYDECLGLDARVRKVVEELDRLGGASA